MDENQIVESQELERLPGLFRRWEFAEVIQSGRVIRVEDAGTTVDGTELYAIYAGRISDRPRAIPPWARHD
jgi:hypothetical protein